MLILFCESVIDWAHTFKLSLCSCSATDSRLDGHELLITLIALIYSQNASETNCYKFLVTETENDALAGSCFDDTAVVSVLRPNVLY